MNRNSGKVLRRQQGAPGLRDAPRQAADIAANIDADIDAQAPEEVPFWRRKSLAEMTPAEWESLCDGCGKCCLSKLEDEDTGKIYFTSVGCRLLDGATCRCHNYEYRNVHVPDCVRLTPENVTQITWLPRSCAYRLIAEGKDLYWWHPLVSGDPETVHQAGMSVRGRLSASEEHVPDEELEDHIVNWPQRVVKKSPKAR